MRTRRQKFQLELALEQVAQSEARSAGSQGTKARMARADPERPAAGPGPSMEAVVQPGNLKKALARVRRNRGAPGRDGIRRRPWGPPATPLARDQVPPSRRRLRIAASAADGVPEGIGPRSPAPHAEVLDRFIQQAVMQAWQEALEGSFSDASSISGPPELAPARSSTSPFSKRVARRLPRSLDGPPRCYIQLEGGF